MVWRRILFTVVYHTYVISRTDSRNSCSTGVPIILGRCPSLSAHESEFMLRTFLVCRKKQDRKRERERETSKRHVGEAHSVIITAILLSQHVSCYWGKTVSLRMLTNHRFADLRLNTVQQRAIGQNLLSDLQLSFVLGPCFSSGSLKRDASSII
jgi:hypothetical protein